MYVVYLQSGLWMSKMLWFRGYCNGQLGRLRSAVITTSVLSQTSSRKNSALWYVLDFCWYVNICDMPSVHWRCWLGGRKGIQPVKIWVMGCWHGYLSGARCRLALWPSWCHCHSLSLAPIKSRLVLPFWYQLTRVFPDRGLLNGCMYVKDLCSVQTVSTHRFWMLPV